MLSLAVVFVGILFVDISISRLYNLLVINVELQLRLTIFSLICLFSISLPLIIMYFIRNIIPPIKKFHLEKLSRAVWIVQGGIAIIILAMFIQVVFFGRYTIALTAAAEILGLLGSCALLGVLSFLFFKSYRQNKSFLVLSYVISSAFASLHSLLSGLLAFLVLSHKPAGVSHLFWTNSHVILQPGSYDSILSMILRYSTVISFILLWISTGKINRRWQLLQQQHLLMESCQSR